jgi:hypothetical protein
LSDSIASVRSDIHRTARPSFIAAAEIAKYSGYVDPFIPNPPPTSGFVTRTVSFASPKASISSSFCPQTPCPFTQRCSFAPSHSA